MSEEIAVELLREIKEILDKIGIDYWLDSGTLLGAVRDGKIIELDTDVDLGTWYDEIDQITSVLDELEKRRFRVVSALRQGNIAVGTFLFNVNITLYQRKGDYAWNLWVAEEKKIESILYWCFNVLSLNKYGHFERGGRKLSYLEPFLRLPPLTLRRSLADIVWSILDNMNCIIPVVIPKYYFEKLSTIQFYGMEFNVPFDVEKYLEFRYGKNWKIPTKKWIYYKDDGAIKPNWSRI